MKKQLFTIFSILFGFLGKPLTTQAQLEFVENQGQWPGGYGMMAKMNHGDFWLKGNQVAFVLSDFGNAKTGRISHPHGNPDKARNHCYTVDFVGASSKVTLQGGEVRKHYHNYYLSNDKTRWKTRVPLYAVARHSEIYPQTELVWKEEKGNLKYEFVLQPGARVAAIKMKYKGLDKMELKNGKLVLHTSLGKVTEQQPVAFQTINGRKTKVQCNFQMLGSGMVGFQMPKGYDPTQTLVIDPVLIFSSYSGSRSDNWGFTATYGEGGATYAAGIALGTKFPVTTGAFQQTFHGDSTGSNFYSTFDIGILKFSSSGNELLFSTYLGGSEAEIPSSIVVDHQNNLVVLGATSSANFPVTNQTYDSTYNGGSAVSPYGPAEEIVQFRQGSDIIVAKFNAEGTALLGSTFLGGNSNDGVLPLVNFGNSPLVRNYGDSFRGEVAVDSAGNVYLASHSSSSNFPRINPLQNAKGGGFDAVFAKFSPGLNQLLMSTFLGGNADDGAYSLQVSKGIVYMAGGTASTNFPRTTGSIKPTFGGDLDGFVCRFNPNQGLSSLKSSYMGTGLYDQAYFVQLDSKGQVYVCGQTKGNYPVSSNVYNNPNGGQFIHGLSPNLDSTRFSTVFGSGGNETNISLTAFLVDDCGRIYCSGWGGSTNQIAGYQNGTAAGLQTTPDAYGRSTNGSEFYILALDKNATALSFATYFGDTLSGIEHVDGGTSRFDKKGVVYQAVCAGCDGNTSTFPTTPGVFSNTNNSAGRCNNAVFKYDFSLLKARFQPSVIQACAPASITFTGSSVFATSYRWDFGLGQPPVTTLVDTITHLYDTAGTFTIKLVAINADACPGYDSIQRTIVVQKAPVFAGDSLAFCSFSDTIQLPALPAGIVTYAWEPSTWLNNPESRSPKAISPQQSIVYKGIVKTGFGCKSENIFKISNGILMAKAKADTLAGCMPLTISFANQSYQQKRSTWYWSPTDSATTQDSLVNHTFNQAGVYPVVLKVENDTTCFKQSMDTLWVRIFRLPVFQDTLTRFCNDESLVLHAAANEGQTFSWSPAGLLNDSTLVNPVFLSPEPQVFTLNIADQNKCKATARVDVRDGRLKANFTMGTDNVCVPSVIQLVNQSLNPQQSRWLWIGDSATVLQNGTVPVTVNSTGIFRIKLKVLSDTACNAFDEVEKTIVLGGVPSIPPATQIFCPGDSVAIAAIKLPGYQYTWPAGVRAFASDSSRARLFGVDTTTVVVGLHDSLGCPGSQQIVLLPSKPVSAFTYASRFEKCTDALKYEFNAVPQSYDGYLWTMDGNTLSGKDIGYQFVQRGIYNAALIVTLNGCKDTLNQLVTVNDAPLDLEAGFSVRTLLKSCNELPVVEIENQTVGATKSVWSWAGNTVTARVPEIVVEEAGSLAITLDAYQDLCLKSITKEIDVRPASPPNLVTANDDGINDAFVIRNLPEGSRLEIRDRWGVKIYSTDNYKNDWKPAEGYDTVFYDLGLPEGKGCHGWILIQRGK